MVHDEKSVNRMSAEELAQYDKEQLRKHHDLTIKMNFLVEKAKKALTSASDIVESDPLGKPTMLAMYIDSIDNIISDLKRLLRQHSLYQYEESIKQIELRKSRLVEKMGRPLNFEGIYNKLNEGIVSAVAGTAARGAGLRANNAIMNTVAGGSSLQGSMINSAGSIADGAKADFQNAKDAVAGFFGQKANKLSGAKAELTGQKRPCQKNADFVVSNYNKFTKDAKNKDGILLNGKTYSKSKLIGQIEEASKYEKNPKVLQNYKNVINYINKNY